MAGLWRRFTRSSRIAARAEHRYARRREMERLPSWDFLHGPQRLEWETLRNTAAGPRVLLATLLGGHPSAPVLDGLLAVALTLRGARVSFLLCDEALPACAMAEAGLVSEKDFAREGPQGYFCGPCHERGGAALDPFGLPVHRISEWAPPAGGAATLRMGDHARAGALRFLARSDLDASHSEAILARYQAGAAKAFASASALLAKHPQDVVCVNHGIYVPQGPIVEAAREAHARVVTWNLGYRRNTFIFSHEDTYHRTLLTEDPKVWEGMPWDDDLRAVTSEYLESRRRGGRDWIGFQDPAAPDDFNKIAQRWPRFDAAKPFIGLLTNVAWDAQIHYPANAYPSMFAWLEDTIRFFAQHPEKQLVIRVHPAEVRGDIPSRQPVTKELSRLFPQLPPNVFVIPPEDPASTYAVMERADTVLVYGTKTGIEMASRGIPVIVAGEAWVRNKGITTDAASRDHYRQLLARLPVQTRLSPDVQDRALRYAFHFFFRRMIPLTCIQEARNEPPFAPRLDSLSGYEAGRDPGLDVICIGILEGAPFVFPAERMQQVTPAP